MPAEKVKFTHAEIASYYAHRVPDLKQTSSGEWRGRCPIHQGERDSFAVKRKTGEWFCHSECIRGGSIIKLEAEITGVEFKSARKQVLRIIGREWRTVARYIYR
jgi:DNA primase